MSQKRSFASLSPDSTDSQPPQHAPFALHGTPLPAYDPDARDDGSYLPLWKQEVTDERGRKRLHGAFTGGFSAGYFNTVGSKEGWTPAAFTSSRTNRALKKEDGGGGGQRREDFMDEEDLAAMAESQGLETQGAFAGLGASGNGAGDGQGKGMFGDVFRTTGETMGVKLLQRMGWRQGQGVGPKVRRKAKGDEKGEVHLFAPENSRMIGFVRKSDRKGMGFAGEERLGIEESQGVGGDGDEAEDGQDARIVQTNRSKLISKPKKMKKSGIGIGALNDTGSDDEDEYDMGPRINYTRVIGPEKKKKKAGLVASNANNAVSKPGFTSSSYKALIQRSTTVSGFRKCHDGRLPLAGFVLTMASLALFQENKYPPPTVPADWRPTKLSQTADAKATSFQTTADAAKASTLDPKSRAALLGEQQLPGKSIFDFLSPAARNRVATASGRTNLPPALNEKAPAGFEASEADKRRTLWDRVPQLDKTTAEAALQRGTGGWMPYAEDEEKRERYRYYLQLNASTQSNLPERSKGTTVEDWARELQEFKQAAEVFRPISGLMATRFTSSTSSAPHLASDAPDSVRSSNGKDEGKVEDPAEKAARVGMFGSLTRSRQVFYPTRLLCKRFNVKSPATVAPDPGGEAGSDGRLEVVSQANLNRMMMEADFSKLRSGISGDAGAITPGGGFVSHGRDEMVGVKATEVDAEKNDALEGQKAGEELFQAVFGGEDEDS